MKINSLFNFQGLFSELNEIISKLSDNIIFLSLVE